MILLDFFRKNRMCGHNKVQPDVDIAYCPDCGELVENEWFIARCACCGVKSKATIKNGEVVSNENFCHNCGAKSFLVEKVAKINFIDIQYSVIVKRVVNSLGEDFTQSWAENACTVSKKLLSIPLKF